MSNKERIPTNLRTLLILEILGKNNRAMTATEINDFLRLPKQTVHRLCSTLEENGFLTRVGHTKRYQAARRLRDLGMGLLYNSRDHIARRQILLNIANKVKETVNFVVPEASGMNYIDRVETDWAFRIQLPIGTNVPFHCTASGKCFLASLSPKKRKAMIEAMDLKAHTKRTHIRKAALLSELKQVSKQGYALDQEEFMDGMVAIAVPIKDNQGRFAAALAFHGPTQRISIENALARKDILAVTAKQLADSLFNED